MDKDLFKDMTIDHLRLHRPDLIIALRSEFKKDAETAAESKKEEFCAQAVKDERARCAGIMEEAAGFAAEGEKDEFSKGIRTIALEAVKDGSTRETAVNKFQAKKIDALQLNKNPNPGPGAEAPEGAQGGLQGEDLWKWQYANDKKVAGQFSSEKRYIAYMKASARGAVKEKA